MSSNEPSLTQTEDQAEDDNSFVCRLPRLTDFQCIELELLTACAATRCVNGIIVEGDTREPMSLRSFCRGQAV